MANVPLLARKLVLGISALAISGVFITCAWRSCSDPEVDLGPPVGMTRSRPEPRSTLRLMTYNIAHGRAQSFHQSLLGRQTIQEHLRQIGQLIVAQDPDVVGLQELDGPSVWSGHFDHAESLARYTGYAHVFRGHHAHGIWPLMLDYGTGLLSRFPAQSQASFLFDTTWRDNKGFVIATLQTDVAGLAEIAVVSLHLDFASAETRRLQLEVLARTLPPARPLAVLGDFNCDWQAENCVRWFAEKAGLHAYAPAIGQATFPSPAPQRQLDWILISPDLSFVSLSTVPQEHSDHLAVVADLAVDSPD